MNIKDQAISAGGSFKTPGGKQFLLAEAVDDVRLTFYNSAGHPFEEAENVKGGFKRTFVERIMSVRIESATAQTIKYGLAEEGDAEYSRAQGDVNATIMNPTIDQVTVNKLVERDISDYYDVLTNKNSFIGYFHVGAVSAQYSLYQLHNPVGSGKKIVFSNERCTDDTNIRILGYKTSQLIVPTNRADNKYLGQAASVAFFDQGSLASFGITSLSAQAGKVLKFEKRIIVPEGYYLVGYINATNQQYVGAVEWQEI